MYLGVWEMNTKTFILSDKYKIHIYHSFVLLSYFITSELLTMSYTTNSVINVCHFTQQRLY